MVPELPIALLACSRIGAPHSVVFGGFSSDSLRDRIKDAEAKVLITGDGAWRRGSIVPLKETADAAVAECPSIEKVLVLRRTAHDVPMTDGRDVWWHDLVPRQSADCAPEPMDAEDLLYLLYTSGTTGEAQGHHAHHRRLPHPGGVDAQVRVRPAPRHRRLLVRRPTSAGSPGTRTSSTARSRTARRACIYEGTPDYPDKDRLWQIIEKYKVTILYTAPTAIRTFMKWGPEFPESHDLSSLRLLGSVGEPINPEAWVWYWQHIGGERCPVVDTWWQTETGAIMISPLPGATTLKPGSATFPLPGIGADIVDDAGRAGEDPGRRLPRAHPAVAVDAAGHLGRPRALPGDLLVAASAAATSRATAPSATTTATSGCSAGSTTSCSCPGHNISTAEVEHALVGHPAVAEAAVVGTKDDTTGQAIGAFVILRSRQRAERRARRRAARPRRRTPSARSPSRRRSCSPRTCPKTRSGKIMRRLLRDVAEDQAFGDTTTLADPSVVEGIKARYLAAATADDE